MNRFMQQALYLTVLSATLAGCAAPVHSAPIRQPQAVAVRATGVQGDVRHHPGVASRHLGNQRDVWVYLPPGYEQARDQRYPVLYMHDGNNAFDPAIAFAGQEWHLDEHAERMIKSGELPPFILVAVSNTPDRLAEYTWVPGEFDGRRQGGKGQRYARFLIEELKPLVDRTYRTKPDREHTAVMGSSMGGQISLRLGLHHPEVFGRIGAISPGLFWADRVMLEEARAMPKELKIWLDMGVHEEEHVAFFKGAIDDARTLRQRLEARGYREGRNLGYYEDPDGWHNEGTWARRAPMFLRFLMGSSAD